MSAAERHRIVDAPVAPAVRAPGFRVIGAVLDAINRMIVVVASVAVVAAGVVLTHEAATRYLFHAPADWQDELAVFLLVGATFLSSAFVQARRGHVAIDAVAGLLPRPVERIRRRVADAVSLAFCAFFAWKSWSLFAEAWDEGMVTSSAWAPPLWIPYGLMAVGMTLLAMQILLQLFETPADPEGTR